jgi:hypothetical protein
MIRHVCICASGPAVSITLPLNLAAGRRLVATWPPASSTPSSSPSLAVQERDRAGKVHAQLAYEMLDVEFVQGFYQDPLSMGLPFLHHAAALASRMGPRTHFVLTDVLWKRRDCFRKWVFRIATLSV